MTQVFPHAAILYVSFEEAAKFVKGNKLHTVVEIDVAGTRDPDQLLGLGSTPVGILAELARVSLVTGDEEQGTGRDGVDVIEGVEVEELYLARARRVSRGVGQSTGGCHLTAGGAVEVVELLLNSIRSVLAPVHGAADQLGLCAVGLVPALGHGGVDELLALGECLRPLEAVAGDGAHVVHARSSNGLETGVDLCGADEERAAAADTNTTDAPTVDKVPGAEVVDGGAECLYVVLGRNGVARLAVAAAPVGEVDGDGDEALLGELGGVEVGALLLDGAHGVTDGNGGRLNAVAQVAWIEEVARDVGAVLGWECDGLNLDALATVEVVGSERQVLGRGGDGVDERYDAEGDAATSKHLDGIGIG